MADGYIGIFIRNNIPSQPTGLVLTEINDTVSVVWNVNSTEEITQYELWSSIGDTSNYILRDIISLEEFEGNPTITVIDDSYNLVTTVYYKVFARYMDSYSDALTGNKVLAYSVPDPTALLVGASTNKFSLRWKRPTSRLLENLTVVKDAQVVEGDLSEGAAVEVYEGLAGGMDYEVPSPDPDESTGHYGRPLWGEVSYGDGTESDIPKYHQFWVSSNTKT